MKPQHLVRGRGSTGVKTTRLSITLESEKADALAVIAEEKRVSLAWVMRDAIDQYLIAAGKNLPK